MKQHFNLRSVLLKGILALAMLGMLACGDQDFSDPNNPSIGGPSETPETLVAGIFSAMRTDYHIYLREVATFGREAYYFEQADPRWTGELLRDQVDAGSFLIGRPWAARYRAIRNANAFLGAMDRFNFDSAQASGARGFAKTIQAHQFLMNLNLTNENGIRVDVAGDSLDDLGPIVSKAEAFAFIADLLDEAYAELLNGGSNFGFALTSGFAEFDTPADFAKLNRGFKARVEVYRENYESALSALNDSFLDTGADLNMGAYFVYSTGSGDQTNPIFEVPTAASIKLVGHPSMLEDAEDGDLRFSSKIFIRSEPFTFDGLSSTLAVTVSNDITAPFPIIRNEELILLRAEANANLGNIPEAEADVNRIREQAGLAAVTLSDASQALIQVLHEKRFSLFIEGYRWIDLRKYDMLDTLPLDRESDKYVTSLPIPDDEPL